MIDLTIKRVKAADVAEFAAEVDQGMIAAEGPHQKEAYVAANFPPEHEALGAYFGDTLIGVSYWMEWQGNCFECLSYVRECHRGQGVYSAMFKELVAISRERGWVHIDASVSVENGNSRMIHETLGFKAPIVYFRYEIAPAEAA